MKSLKNLPQKKSIFSSDPNDINCLLLEKEVLITKNTNTKTRSLMKKDWLFISA